MNAEDRKRDMEEFTDSLEIIPDHTPETEPADSVACSELVGELEAELIHEEKLMRDHAAYGGMLYAKYSGRAGMLKDVIAMVRRRSATDVVSDRGQGGTDD